MNLFSPKPTEEQEQALSLFRSGKNLKINAYAGAGKTSTLKLLAESRPGKSLYTAFNRDIAERSRKEFPSHVTSSTTHAIASQFVALRWGFTKSRLKDSAKPREIASFLALPNHTQFDIPFRKPLRALELADLIQATVNNFLNSADTELSARHVSHQNGFSNLEGDHHAQVASVMLPYARRLWEAMTDIHGSVPLGHSGYYKLWSLEFQELPYECIFLDEAQDSNPPLLAVLDRQQCQIVYVGDPYQQIYSWRGAVNAMTQVRTELESSLTLCFRFGQPIAEAAFQVIRTLGAREPLRGNPERTARIGQVTEPECVITRTNMALMEELARREEIIHRCSLGKKQRKSLLLQLNDVVLLKQEKLAFSDELRGYRSWDDVHRHVELGTNPQLRSFCRLVDTFGEQRLIGLVKRTCSGERADAISFTTAHRSKGQQWNRVVLSADFFNKFQIAMESDRSRDGSYLQDENWQEEVRLFYVALTRAREEVQLPAALLSYFEIAGSQDAAAGRPAPPLPASNAQAGVWVRRPPWAEEQGAKAWDAPAARSEPVVTNPFASLGTLLRPPTTIARRAIFLRGLSCSCGTTLQFLSMVDTDTQRLFKHVNTANSILVGPGAEPLKQRILKCRGCGKLYELERPGSICGANSN